MEKNSTGTTKTPNYAASLLKPRAQGQKDRSVWAIGLAAVWIPFFTATNAAGESNIPSDVLGAPIRLQRNQDGTPKFSKAGKPVLRTVKELSDQIRIVRDNFTFGLMAYAETVRKEKPAEFKAQVEASQKAGAPVVQSDTDALMKYLDEVNAKSAPAAAEAVLEHATEATEKELVPA